MAISSRVTKQISSPVTKRNPRPRKYASQADRQAAYRARNVMLEFRAEPKTADNITKIAETLGYPRSDVLLSMVKFALTNHDWARFGLTHKTIPTYKENPMQSWMIVNKQTGEAVLETYNKAILSKLNTEKYEAIPALKYLVALNKKIKENPTMKPASPAQLAARKRFAEMARSGAFKKATKRKANPAYRPIIKAAMNIRELAYDLENISQDDKKQISDYTDAEILHEAKYVLDIYHESGTVSNDALMGEHGKDEQKSARDDVRKLKALIKKFGATTSRKTNPAKKTVSQKVSQLVNEGYPQRQAVAVALSEQRADKVKHNPMLPMRKIQIATNNEIVIDYKYTGYGVTQKKDKTFVYNMKTGNEIFLPKQRYVLSTENGQNQFLVDFEEAVALSEQRAGKIKRNPSKRTYEVYCQSPGMNIHSWTKLAIFYSAEKAKQYAKTYAKAYPSHYVRVESHG